MSNHPTAILHRGPSIYEPRNNYFNDCPIEKRFRGSLEISGTATKSPERVRTIFEEHKYDEEDQQQVAGRWTRPPAAPLPRQRRSSHQRKHETHPVWGLGGGAVERRWALGRAGTFIIPLLLLYRVFPQKVRHVPEDEASATPLTPPLPALIQSHQDPLHAALSMRIIMRRRLSGRTRTCAAVRYDNQAPASPL